MASPVQAQLAADATGVGATVTHTSSSTVIGGVTHTQTHVIPKLTRGGTDGSATITDGRCTSYTAPT